MKFDVSSKPFRRCRECDSPIIFPVVIPPIKRASTHSYEWYRVQCIIDKDLCRKCHQQHLPILDRLRPEEMIIGYETIHRS